MEPLAYDQDRLELFDGALQALLSGLQPSAESDAARRGVVSDMQALVAEAMDPSYHAAVETFGSFRAGLHLPGSDLDFAVTAWVHRTMSSASSDSFGTEQQVVVDVHDWAPLQQQQLLAELADALEDRGLVQGQVERVLHARVPVIKCVHRATGLACDFSISRPECAFKAEMQKLLGCIDRRYASLYRLVKLWAAAHGLNDASSSTLNSWSWGLMVAFHLQCEQPAVLPPIWQLLERQPPRMAAPRILQAPGINPAALKRALNLAAVGAGAFTSKRSRQGLNPRGLGELLAGFFELFGEQMSRWVEGVESGTRCCTWWGSWVEAPWPVSKPYIFGIEDPFNAADNTARSVGTHNHLSCTNSARYIAWAMATSAKLLREALDGKKAAAAALPSSSAAAAAEDKNSSTGVHSNSDLLPHHFSSSSVVDGPGSPGSVSLVDWLGGSTGSTACAGSTGSTGCDEAACHQILTALTWLVGPAALLQLPQLPQQLQQQLARRVPAAELAELTAEVTLLGDCSAALGNSSSLGCSDSKNSCLSDPQKVQQTEQALQLFKKLLQKLDAADLSVCMGDYQQLRRQQVQQRWQQQQEAGDREQLLQGLTELRVRSAPPLLQMMQKQKQQQQRGHRGQQLQPQQQGYEVLSGAGAVISAALRPAGAMTRQAATNSSSNSSTGHSSSMPQRARAHSLPTPAAAAAAAAHGAAAAQPPAFTRGGSSSGSSRGSHPPIPVPASSGSNSRQSRQGPGLSRQLSAEDGQPSGSSRDAAKQRSGGLAATAPAAGSFMGRGAGRGRGAAAVGAVGAPAGSSEGCAEQGGSVASGNSSRQRQGRGKGQQQQQQQQQRERQPRGGFAAVALSQVGLTASNHVAAAGQHQQQQQQRGGGGGGRGSDDGGGSRRSRASSSEQQQQQQQQLGFAAP